MLGVIPAATKEWLTVTSDGVPVSGWPVDDSLDTFFSGHIPFDDHEKIKQAIKQHFDPQGGTCIFPIVRVEVKCGTDDRDQEDITLVTIVGDRDRAGEMSTLQSLLLAKGPLGTSSS